jgi:hypothetical protein
MMRIILAGALILSSIYAAHAFGLGQGNRFGKLGAFSKKGSGGGGGGGGCTGTTLAFTTPCNSMYIPIIH